MRNLFPVRRRFQLFFALEYAAIGIFMPYVALYLNTTGLSGAQVGILLGLMPLAVFLVQPLWGLLSDIYGLRRTSLVLGCFGVALSAVGLELTTAFHWLFLVILMMSVMRGPITPIGTALALEYLENEKRRDEFGALRLWGSLGFVLASLGIGLFVLDQAIEYIVWLYSLDMFLLGLVGLGLPDAPITHKANWREGLTLLKREGVLAAFLLGILLIGMTLGVVNQYLAVYLEDIHATGWIIGLATALAAAPEIPLMAVVPKMLSRWGLAAVFIGGIAVLPVRWLLYTVIDEPLLVIPTQFLHGIALTALIVVGVIYVDRQLSRHWRATGQALYAAMLYGIGPSLGLFTAGFLYERGGITPLWIFCTLAGLAGVTVVAWAMRAPVAGQITERSQL